MPDAGPLCPVEHRISGIPGLVSDLRIAVLADLHVIWPWTSASKVAAAVAQANATGPDLILLPGDFLASLKLPGWQADAQSIAAILSDLDAPLGVHAVLGNHDWRDCPTARRTGYRETSVGPSLEAVGITVLSNASRALGETGLWLAGIDSQKGPGAVPDPDLAFRDVPGGAPAILLAHEPDYFAKGDRRAFLQVSGHTHGGQANLLGWRPMTPSRFGGRYAWGHIRDGDRHLVVSGGVGYSGVPLRILQPPELTLIHLTQT